MLPSGGTALEQHTAHRTPLHRTCIPHSPLSQLAARRALCCCGVSLHPRTTLQLLLVPTVLLLLLLPRLSCLHALPHPVNDASSHARLFIPHQHLMIAALHLVERLVGRRHAVNKRGNSLGCWLTKNSSSNSRDADTDVCRYTGMLCNMIVCSTSTPTGIKSANKRSLDECTAL